MSELVALHTQRLVEPAASLYLQTVGKALRAARLNKSFPDRRQVQGTLQALGPDLHGGLYGEIYLDSRAGLPNMASFTRVLADRSVGLEALGQMRSRAELEARRGEADVYERRARKRAYFEALAKMELAPVDEHRVLLRRHEPEQSRASFRVELTKLTGAGRYLRVVIELTQTSGLWAHKLIGLDQHGEVAEGTDALRSMVYRFAGYDAETLFLRLHELDGVHVERVQRGIIGAALFHLPTDAGLAFTLEPHDDALARAWSRWAETAEGTGPELVMSFATDVAANDVREEKSNDPLRPLMSAGIADAEQARYRALRERYPFRVYKDRKFVASKGLVPTVKGLCEAMGTKNIVYPLR